MKENDRAIYIDKDSYQIYATLLEGQKHTLYVIEAVTDAYPGMTSKNLGIEGDKEFMREWGAVMDDYAKQNQTEKLLQRGFPLQTPYELISDSKSPEELGRLLPTSGGFYFFSAVGFNPTRTRAIVNMGHHCGMLCGGGGPHFFKKKDGIWREVTVEATITVWVS